MFDQMLETTTARGRRGYAPLAVSAALAGHVAAVLCMASASLLIVESLSDPEIVPPVFLSPVNVVFDPPRSETPRRDAPTRGGEGSPQRVSRPRPAAPALHPESPQVPPDVPLREALEDLGEPEAGGSGLPGPGTGPGAGWGAPGPGDGPGVLPEIGDGSVPRPVEGDIEAPVLEHRVEPTYPEVARRARISGRVFLRAVIGISGSVEKVEVLSSTSPLLEDAAASAVSRWKYRPARYHGVPVAVYFTVTVRFVVN